MLVLTSTKGGNFLTNEMETSYLVKPHLFTSNSSCNLSLNIADILTKSLPSDSFLYFRQKLNVVAASEASMSRLDVEKTREKVASKNRVHDSDDDPSADLEDFQNREHDSVLEDN
ncbi:hypothetical protein PIB30_021649 [Stylosanthes scabra]|uniref:Uncharacterized protein n=1 Tax=Stylosanthes scabra TaxID=79078 RepID=A0ABU6Y5Y8_9FABA|nr:hypothetical protein [Stylosanthes scabra]